MLLLESQLAACWTYHTAAYFHGAPDTQRAIRLPLFASQDTSVLMWPGNARHPLTGLLPHFPQARWSWVSQVYFPFSSASRLMKLQLWQQVWMTSEFSEVGELPEITRFINSLNQGLTTSSPGPQASQMPQKTIFMEFQRYSNIIPGR